jgi:hypothetical protein
MKVLFCPLACPRALPRSGYTEQPRVLTLGQAVNKRCPESGTRCWDYRGITNEQPKDAPLPPLFLLRPTFPELRRTGRADFGYA